MATATIDLPPGFVIEEDPQTVAEAGLPPGFVLEKTPVDAALPEGFVIEENPEEARQTVTFTNPPAELPEKPGSPAPTQEPEVLEMPEIEWKGRPGFAILPDGRVMFDPDRLDWGTKNAFEAGVIDGKQYGEIMPAVHEFQAAVSKRRELEAEAGALPELKSFTMGAGRGGAMTLGFLGGAKAGGALGAFTGPGAAVASPILAILGGAVGAIGAGKAYDELYKKAAENDVEFAGMLSARELKPAWGTAGELAGIVLPAGLAARSLAQSAAIVAESQGPRAAAAFVGKVAGTGAATGAAVDPAMRGIDRAMTTEQSPAEVLKDGERPEMPLFSPEGMATSALMMAAFSGASTSAQRMRLSEILAKPRSKWSKGETEAVNIAARATAEIKTEFGPGVRASDVSFRQARMGQNPVATLARVEGVRPGQAALPGQPGQPMTGAMVPVGGRPSGPAQPAMPMALPGPVAGQAVMGRGTVPTMPDAPNVIPMPSRAAVPALMPREVESVTVPGAGGRTIDVPKQEPLPAPKAKRGFSLDFATSELTPVIRWITENVDKADLQAPVDDFLPEGFEIEPVAPQSTVPNINQTGEGNLFSESEMPFNLSGEVDLTPELQKIADNKQAAKDAQEKMDRDQTEMFASAPQSTGPAQPPPGPQGAPSPTTPAWVLNRPESNGGRSLVKRVEKGKAGLRDIVEFVNREVRVEMRVSRSQTSRRHPAHYRPGAHMVFTNQTQSQINFHEAGHGLKEIIETRKPGAFAPLEKELIALTKLPGSMASGGDSASNAYKLHEGVAEWLRWRLVNPSVVEGTKLNTEMEAILTALVPKVGAALRDASRAMDRFNRLPVAERWALMNKAYADKPGFDTVIQALFRMGGKVADGIASGAPVSRLDRQIFKAIVADRAEVRLSYGKALALARQQRELTNELMQDYNMILSIGSETVTAMAGTGPARGLRVIGKDGNYKVFLNETWKDIMQRVPASKQVQFMQAGWAAETLNRYTEDRLEYPGMREGIMPKDLSEIVAQAMRDIPQFAERFKDVQRFFDAVLDIKEYGGLKAPGETAKMRRREIYWPLPRIMSSGGKTVGAAGMQDIRAGDYRARGSGEAIQDLNIVAEERVRDALTSYYWNQFGLNAVANLGYISRNEKLPTMARALAGRAFTRLKMPMGKVATLSKEEVQRMVYQAVLEQKAMDLGMPPEMVATGFRPEDLNLAWDFKDIFRPVAPKDVNVVSLLRDGEREFYQVGDNSLFMMFARPKQVSTLMRAVQWGLGPMMQNWKRNITQSLPFSAANLAGDVINQMMLNKDAVGWFPGGASMLGMINKLSQKYPQVKQEGILLARVEPSASELVHDVKRNAVVQWLVEGLYVSQAKDPTTRLLATVLQPSNLLFPLWKFGDLVNVVTGGRFVAPALETATREGSAASVKMRGGTDKEAADAYWRVTGRFNEHAGIADVRAAMTIPGFFNPMLQAVRGAGQVLTDPDPAVSGAAWAKLLVVFPAIFGGAAVARYLMMDEDDKAMEKERPIEDRLNYHDVAGFRVRFPYGPEGAMGSFVYNSVMDHLLDRPKREGKREGIMLLKRIADAGTPLQFLGPQLNALTEAQMNWSHFRQRHIVSPWMVGLPASEKYTSTTPDFYRKLGRWMDYSPISIEYIVNQGISRQVGEMIKLVDNISQDKPIDAHADLPFVGRMFMREPLGFATDSMQRVEDLETRLQVLNLRLSSAGYSWLKEVNPAEIADPRMRALKTQIDALGMLQSGVRQLQTFSKLATAARDGQQWEAEQNYRRMMVIYAQSILAVNPEYKEKVEQAVQLIEQLPEASPAMKQADSLNRAF